MAMALFLGQSWLLFLLVGLRAKYQDDRLLYASVTAGRTRNGEQGQGHEQGQRRYSRQQTICVGIKIIDYI